MLFRPSVTVRNLAYRVDATNAAITAGTFHENKHFEIALGSADQDQLYENYIPKMWGKIRLSDSDALIRDSYHRPTILDLLQPGVYDN